MSGQNHYEVLGVSRNADQSQIRAAYVSLLKRHHPDKASANEAQENAAEIQRIVGAYRALKDPRARAAYNARLRRAAAPDFSMRPEPARAGKVRRAGKRFKLDTDTMSYVLMLVVAAIGLQLLVSRLLVLGIPHSTATVLAGTPAIGEVPVNPQLESVVRSAGMMSATGASDYSARCFAAARRSRKAIAADPCVGFDMAYVYWRETAGGPLVIDAYFQPEAMSARAREAFSGLNPIGAAARLQSVRAATLRTIMQTPRAADPIALAFSDAHAGLKAPPAASAAVEASLQKD
jgi:curved DNA-binding protein CbpA